MDGFNYFRGDTILLNIDAGEYTFQKDDVLKVALMKTVYDREYIYENIITIPQEQTTVQVEIPPEKTGKLSSGDYILEFELTTNLGVVSTTQLDVSIKEDGIYERN